MRLQPLSIILTKDRPRRTKVTGLGATACLIAAALVLATSASGKDTDRKSENARHFYVSKNGCDEKGVGSKENPWKTIIKARNAIRNLQPIDRPYFVNLRSGIYYLDETFELTPEDSGVNNERTITYRSQPGETAILSGGMRVKSWSKDGRLWKAYVGRNCNFRQLFVAGKRAIRARTPNLSESDIVGIPREAWHRATSKVAVEGDRKAFHFYTGDIKNWNNLEDVNVIIPIAFIASIQYIDTINTETNTVVIKSMQRKKAHFHRERHPRFYVEGAFELLDAPGEFYLNRKSGYLFYMPKKGEVMNGINVIAPKLHTIVKLTGGKENRYVEYVNFENLSFQHSTWEIPKTGYMGQQADAKLKNAAILAKYCRYVSISKCTINHTGEHGIWFGRGCNNNQIHHNILYDIGAGGIYIGDNRTLNDRTVKLLKTENNFVDNNYLYDGCKVFRSSRGIWLGKYHNNETVIHNEISDFHNGIDIGWTWNYNETKAEYTNATIAFNYIHHVKRGNMNDGGGIFSLGRGDGSVINNNLIHDVIPYKNWGAGIYQDVGSGNWTIINNIVSRTSRAFFGHKCINVTLRNNIWAYNLHSDVTGMGLVKLSLGRYDKKRIDMQKCIFYGHYKCMWGGGKLCLDEKITSDFNCYWQIDAEDPAELKFCTTNLGAWRRITGRDRNSILEDPHFKDPENGDFNIGNSNIIRKIYFREIDQSKIGLDWTPVRPKRKEVRWPRNIVFISSRQTVSKDSASEKIEVEITNAKGNRCIGFSDALIVSSSSPSGRFSRNGKVWSKTNQYDITGVDGRQKFYYKDSQPGKFEITLKCDDRLMNSASQTIVILRRMV